ncbi:MAG TPA: hypothetical protein VF730_08760 [Terracidiphilus sp.]
MELLDRYLEAVKKHLPWQGQHDILAELKANLESQLEDKEAELGRPLNREEAEQWLKQLGPPLQMAARYQKQQYLIGPGVFPIYWYVLRLTLAWCAAIYTIAKVVELVSRGFGAEALFTAVLSLPWVLLINGAIVTLIFAGIEQAGLRFGGKCSFATAGPAWTAGMSSPFDARQNEKKKKRSYASAAAEVIFGFVFFAWLLLIPRYPILWLGPGASYAATLPYKLAPVWWTFYWCLVAMNGFELTWKTVDFVRGAWQGPKRWRHLAMHLLSLVPFGVLFSAPEHVLFLLKNPSTDAAAHGAELASANQGVHTAIAIVLAIVVLQLAWAAGKMGLEAWRHRLAAQ